MRITIVKGNENFYNVELFIAGLKASINKVCKNGWIDQGMHIRPSPARKDLQFYRLLSNMLFV